MKLSNTPLTDRPPIRNRYEFDLAVEEAYRRWRASDESEDILNEEVWDIEHRLAGYTYDEVDERPVDAKYIRHEICLEALVAVVNATIL